MTCDDVSDWCRAIGGQRIAWFEAHRQDLRDAYQRIAAGLPSPTDQGQPA